MRCGICKKTTETLTLTDKRGTVSTTVERPIDNAADMSEHKQTFHADELRDIANARRDTKERNEARKRQWATDKRIAGRLASRVVVAGPTNKKPNSSPPEDIYNGETSRDRWDYGHLRQQVGGQYGERLDMGALSQVEPNTFEPLSGMAYGREQKVGTAVDLHSDEYRVFANHMHVLAALEVEKDELEAEIEEAKTAASRAMVALAGGEVILVGEYDSIKSVEAATPRPEVD